MAPENVTAQTVRGTVVDSLRDAPVGRGFVVLLDQDGNEVDRSLSDRNGRFSLTAPAAGRYRLKSERIGYRAYLSEPVLLLEDASVDFDLRVAALPVRLATLVVAGPGRCNANPDEASNTVLIWEEIRKALAASVWGEEQELFHYHKYSYRRDLNERRSSKISETGSTRSNLTEPPFRSLPAEELSRDGYIVERPDGVWYYIPDALTLLSSEFLGTHCFHVVRDEDARPGQVGLAFEPMADRALPDVEGALWLDEATSELRELEVRHTKLRYRVLDRRIGGTVKFLKLPSGAWIVREWQVRTPKIDVTEHPRYVGGYDAEVEGFTDTGGEIYRVSTRDGATVYEAPLAAVEGNVFDSTSAAGLRGALVGVVGTDFRTVTDSAGRFGLRVPLDGEYTVTLSHPALDSIAAPVQLETVNLVRDSAIALTFAIEHVRSNMRRICGRNYQFPDTRVVFGVVRDAGSGAPVDDAAVTAAWQEIALSGGGAVGNAALMDVEDSEFSVHTDREGFYAICGDIPTRPVTIAAEKGDRASRAASVVFPEEPGRKLKFAWDRSAGASFDSRYDVPNLAWKLDLTLGDLRPEAVAQSDPLLYGVVTDSVSGEPVDGVTVIVNGSHRTVTAADGTYQVANALSRETANRIDFRRLGYAPSELMIEVNTTDREVLLNASIPQLPIEMAEIVVEGERISVPARLVGFYERRKVGIGDFLTEEDWSERSDSYVGHVLERIPGIDVVGWRVLVSSAPYTCRSKGISARIYVDGVSVNAGFIQDMNIHNVQAMEVYQRIADIPARYNTNADQKYGGGSASSPACGVVLIWTK